ncbi:MAG: MarR family winged helix-turn-helix transcriptional regulator [Reyranella sp.]|nr:MarR family winged helix-turn-helix transcriptional regulator [Reyranella sp.]
MAVPSESVVRAWTRLERAHRAALTTVESRLKEAGFPPLAWYDVLLELESAGERRLRPFELQKAMLFTQYNLSRLIDRLEAQGYIVRTASEDDGRGQMLAITAKGRAVRRKIWPVYAAAIEAAVGTHLSPFEARTLADLLEKLYTPRA